MIHYQRAVRALLFVMLLIASPLTLFAQDSEPSAIVGSQITRPLFNAYAQAAEASLTDQQDYTGDNNGFAQFCDGSAAVVNATRPISVEEQALCEQNGIAFNEFLLGYDILAYIADPSLEFVDCVSTIELDSVFAPSGAQNTVWSDIIADDTEETAISVFLPPTDDLSYAILDQTISGFGFRADAQALDSVQAVIDAVAETEGGFAAVPFSALPTTDDLGVQLVDLRNNEIARCVAPSAENVFDQSYLAGTALYSYANSEALAANDALRSVYEVVTSADVTAVANDAGYTAPIESNLERNAEVLASGEAGRQFSRSLTDFQIPATVSGPVNVAGAAGGFRLLENAGVGFTQQFQNVTVTVETSGEADGLRQLCNDETPIVATYAPLSQETLDNCAAIDIEVVEFEVGEQAAVLLANSADDYLACLTTEEITNVWRAPGETTNWQTVNADYPDQEFVLFSGDLGNTIANLMLVLASEQNLALREDTETSSDPLFRAAAVANVEGALTYMSWGQYQDVLDNEQERIQLVAVDAGEGCIAPSEETIRSSEYPLARTLYLAVNQSALSESAPQSYLWSLFSDDNLTQFDRNFFELVTLNDLADIRESLQAAYDEATAARAAATEEPAASTEEAVAPADTEPTDEVTETATEEPVAEETLEATAEVEATVEVTEAVTDEAVIEETVEATGEVTEEVEPTDEVTEAATEEVTEEAEPTDEVTEAATEEATEAPTDEATDETPAEATDEA